MTQVQEDQQKQAYRWVILVAVCLIGFTTGLGYLLLVYGVVMGAATAGASMSLTNALVAQWFRDWRALAMSINNASAALGQLFLVYISYLLLESSGWRLSHLYLGAAVLVVTLPLALLMPRRATQASGMAVGKAIAPERQALTHGPLETTSWSKALRSRPLWQLNGGY